MRNTNDDLPTLTDLMGVGFDRSTADVRIIAALVDGDGFTIDCPPCGGRGWFNERQGVMVGKFDCNGCNGTGKLRARLDVQVVFDAADEIERLKTDLDTANRRGDAWREKFDADTDVIAEYRTRPWLFVPGDRVIVLIGSKMEGGTVRQIRIPGPIRAESVVQVELDEALASSSSMWWFEPDKVEKIGQ